MELTWSQKVNAMHAVFMITLLGLSSKIVDSDRNAQVYITKKNMELILSSAVVGMSGIVFIYCSALFALKKVENVFVAWTRTILVVSLFVAAAIYNLKNSASSTYENASSLARGRLKELSDIRKATAGIAIGYAAIALGIQCFCNNDE